jgi:hypothetical protein
MAKKIVSIKEEKIPFHAFISTSFSNLDASEKSDPLLRHLYEGGKFAPYNQGIDYNTNRKMDISNHVARFIGFNVEVEVITTNKGGYVTLYQHTQKGKVLLVNQNSAMLDPEIFDLMVKDFISRK